MEQRKETLRDMKICRFCLSSSEKDLTSIYQKDLKMAPLTVQIMSCISIEVFPSDGLPQFICSSCKQQTNQSYIFKSNCKKADDALKNFLQTGELIKPERSKLINKGTTTAQILPVKDVKIVEDSEQESSHSKRIKLQDGTEIITLCITHSENSTHDDSSQDSIPNDDDLGDTFQEGFLNESQESVKQVETDIFPCDQCDRTFPLKQLLDLHVQNHSRERAFSCSTCGSEFLTKYNLQMHEKTHSEAKPFSCGICGQEFGRESLLRRHEQTHTDQTHLLKHEKKRPFMCRECDKSFVFKQGLERHMTSFHALDKPHKCNYCEAAFSSQIRLTRHITTHAGLRPYPCKICGRTFLLSHHLTRHMRSHYAAEQNMKPEEAIGQHKCDICSMSFRRKDSLINHSAIHSMVNLRCVICNTAFETADMVKEHITTHLQGLPFPCEKCDYSFENQYQLEEHEVKHAEMEYEEQIEKEVMSEVKQGTSEGIDPDDDFLEEGEVTQFHITDINNPELILTGSEMNRNSDLEGTSEPSKELNKYFKPSTDVQGKPSNTDDEEDQSIKPIFRTEGTKMYERKGPIQRKIPTKVTTDGIKTAPLEQINEKPRIESSGITPDLSNLPSKKPVNVKVGDKVVKVQKFIITKEEMKQMAKLGILEVKNGQVTMKNPGQPILNATIKPIQPSDIENFISIQKQKTPVKQYDRKSKQAAASTSIIDSVIEDFS
ncbi:uncharacterized protein LOC143195274 isoform X2 [Rhynchophorus ferrugineus]|uniref:Uncharacterized protein n=1 Tax=Rhynchophorus ferrugineus TaxID=354439 RepID=A0A834IB55_RHYFE|nr:hypothetical protein GWI33_012547 [Rhynchophorus ferrugineus]